MAPAMAMLLLNALPGMLVPTYVPVSSPLTAVLLWKQLPCTEHTYQLVLIGIAIQ